MNEERQTKPNDNQIWLSGDREKLIEEAARAIYNDDPAWGYVYEDDHGEHAAPWEHLGEDLQEKFRSLATGALSVFEKAHTPIPRGKESDTSTERVKNRAETSHVTPTDDDSVEWRAVAGYEGMYEVSDAGEVRSVPRTVQRSNGADQALAGKMLTKHPDRRGYHLVSLTSDHNVVHRRVHRLVLEAFAGPCPKGHESLHGDGDMHNNHRSNLRWGTRTENVHDSMRHGTLPVGEAAAASKITEQDVRDIRAAQKAGESMRGLARRYELALSTIQAIVHRRSWNHVI